MKRSCYKKFSANFYFLFNAIKAGQPKKKKKKIKEKKNENNGQSVDEGL